MVTQGCLGIVIGWFIWSDDDTWNFSCHLPLSPLILHMPLTLIFLVAFRCRDCLVPGRANEHGCIQLHFAPPLHYYESTGKRISGGHQVCWTCPLCCNSHRILPGACEGADRTHPKSHATWANKVSLLNLFNLLNTYLKEQCGTSIDKSPFVEAGYCSCPVHEASFFGPRHNIGTLLQVYDTSRYNAVQ